MTPQQLHQATWLPYIQPPEGEQVELMLPWTNRYPQRVLTCVSIDGEIFVIARDHRDAVRECWKVLTDIR